MSKSRIPNVLWHWLNRGPDSGLSISRQEKSFVSPTLYRRRRRSPTDKGRLSAHCRECRRGARADVEERRPRRRRCRRLRRLRARCRSTSYLRMRVFAHLHLVTDVCVRVEGPCAQIFANTGLKVFLGSKVLCVLF